MTKFIIDDEYSGVRIDRYLRKKLKNLYLSDIYKMIRKAQIKVNEKKIKQDTRLEFGDVVQLFFKTNEKIEEKFEDFVSLKDRRKEILKNIIVFENENLFIINKISGDVIHKGSGHDTSLLEEYRSYFQNNSINFVNRIDKATSGLVIGAKNIKTARKIAEYIRENRIEKKYYILVHGLIKESNFKIENFLKKDEEKILVSEVEKEGYKKSLTFFKKIKSTEKYTLLEANLKTGRTHQLRVQLANQKNPIVGDQKYGINDKEEFMYLFSYYLNIPDENIQIKLDLPKIFNDKINN
ncbi:MAG: RluA family pseudouridine synthase [Fusobacterium sp.]|nr:RluA family pseudouridine synthase [Fusobacterium sp.]